MGLKILHRPGLIRPTGSQGQSRIFEPIGSISQSIADTRYIIVVKLIKSVIANPTEGQEGLRPVRSPKSFSEAPSPSTISFYVNSVYNSSEIDKIRYCQPNRLKGGPTACAEPEVVFRGTITFNYLVLVLIRYIIVVKLIKPVIANSTEEQEGLRPPRSAVLSYLYNKEIIF